MAPTNTRPAIQRQATSTTARASELKPTKPAPRTYTADRLSDRARQIIHKAIQQGTYNAAGWSGRPLAEIAAEFPDPATREGKAIHDALREAEKRAYTALTSYHRYSLVEADEETATLRTPAQLDTQTGKWGGIYYGLNMQTGLCTCPDHQGHIPRINTGLMEFHPTAAPVVCKHFVMLAIMAVETREIILPNRATAPARAEPAPAPPQSWELRYHDGDPAASRLMATIETREKAEAELSYTLSTYATPDRAQRYARRTFFITPAPIQTAPTTTSTHPGDF